MKICIIRNTEVETNASMIRIIDATMDIGTPITLTRSRTRHSFNGRVIKKDFIYKHAKIANYEIQINSEREKGILNIFQLIYYQFCVFFWLLFNKRDYDILHVFDLDSGMPSILVAKLLRKKIVYHIADFYIDSRKGIPSFLKNIIRKLEFALINSSDAAIICTDERKEQIKGSKPKLLYVIYNTPIPKDSIHLSKRDTVTRNFNLTLCYVGALVQTRFIEQIINTVKRHPDIILNIAGLGPLENFVVDEANKSDNIHYFGKLDYQDAINLYVDCDVMFSIYDPKIPNHKFSAPNKVYEAMMLDKPIIVAKGTGIDKIVYRERIGFVIDYSEESFDELIEQIVKNKELLDDMTERTAAVYPKFSWSNMKKRVHELYKNIME